MPKILRKNLGSLRDLAGGYRILGGLHFLKLVVFFAPITSPKSSRMYKPTFFVTTLLCLLCLSGCFQRSGSSPTPTSPTGRSSTHVQKVERQLLATVKQAEQLEPGNPLLLSSLYSLASFYRGQKAYNKAAQQYQRVLDLKEHISGPNHPDLVAILQGYASLLFEANRPKKAAQLRARAGAIQAQTLPRKGSPP